MMAFSRTTAAGSGRSHSRPRKDVRRPLTEVELQTLRRVADALIPGGDGLRAGSALADFRQLAERALAILDADFDQVVALLAELADVSQDNMFGRLEQLDSSDPGKFYSLSLVVAGAYLYSPEMRSELGYPIPHSNPPGMFEFAEELESGILEPVIERGPVYVK